MKKIYIALFALLAVGSTFTACTEEEPFATVTENDDPHILAPVFPDRTNGQLATFANISRDANLSIALTVTPKDYTTVTWFIDGQEVESGTDSDKEINRSLKAGTYNLKIEVETVKGKKTSREGLVVVNPLADDPQSKEVAFERIVSPGKTARLYGSNLQNVTAILLGGNTITDPTYVESADENYLEYTIPTELQDWQLPWIQPDHIFLYASHLCLHPLLFHGRR